MRRRAPWRNQPPFGTPVDWGHPLAEGLMCLWNPRFPGHDAVTGFIGQPSSSALTTAPDAFLYRNQLAQSFQITGGSAGGHYPYQASLSASSIGAAQDFTALQILPQRGANYWTYTNNKSAATATGFQFYSGGGSAWQFEIGSGSVNYATGAITPTGQKTGIGSAVWGQRLGSTIYVYSGTQAASIAATSVALPATAVLNVGGGAGATVSPRGGIGVLWGRGLSLRERLLLEESPWQLFLPPRRRVYSLPSGTVIAVSLAESGAAADSLAAQLAAVSALAESGSASDSLSAVAAFVAGLAAVAAAADSPSAVKATSGAIVEAGSSADTVSAAMLQAVSVAEAGAASAAVSAILAAAAAVGESGAAADALSAVSHILESLAEAGSASESLQAAAAYAAAVSGTGSVADAVSAALAAVSSITEAGSAADTLSWSGNVYSVTVAESGAAAMAIQAAEFAVATLATSGAAADALAALADVQAALGEAGNAVDQLHAVGDFTVVLADAGSAVDVLNWLSGKSPQGADRVLVLPYGKRILVVSYGRRIQLQPPDTRIQLQPPDTRIQLQPPDNSLN